LKDVRKIRMVYYTQLEILAAIIILADMGDYCNEHSENKQPEKIL